MIPIKIECACGQHYAFEIEPVDGAMPSPVACPACGADGTPAANQKIAQYLKAWSVDESLPEPDPVESAESRNWIMTASVLGLIAVITVFAVAWYLKKTPLALSEIAVAGGSKGATNRPVEDELIIASAGSPDFTPEELAAINAPPPPGTDPGMALGQVPEINHNFAAWPALMHARLGANRAGGYSYLARQNGRVVAGGAEGFVRMNYEKDHPGVAWNVNHKLPVAEVSKFITTVALMKLWEEKNQSFSFDDPFWPILKNQFPKVAPEVRKITLRQLLSHRDGFNSTAQDRKKAGMILATLPDKRPFGMEHSEHLNYFLARLVLEQLSGEPYTQYVRAHVLKPAGVPGMDTKLDPLSPVLAYTVSGERTPGFAFAGDYGDRAGATGWFASVPDLTLLMYATAEGKIISTNTLNAMVRRRIGCWPTRDGQVQVGFHAQGAWSGKSDQQVGAVRAAVVHFGDGVDAALLINSDAGDPARILTQAWHMRVPEKTAATNAHAPVEK